jgi:acetolactate synthase-1/3 small subunit
MLEDPKTQGPMRHIIAILLQNEAGALSRVAGLFSARGYNIESLAVAPTDDPRVSRLTLVTTGNDAVIAQILAQLHKLVDVVEVEDMTRGEHFERELLLLKLKVPERELAALKVLVEDAGARLLADDPSCCVIEVTGREAQVSRFLAQASQRGDVLEVVRSGALGVAKGPVTRARIRAA